MARRTSFLVSLERAARMAARAQREAAASERRRLRDHIVLQREELRTRQQMDKWERERYLASRQSATDKLNAELSARLITLQEILARRCPFTEEVVLRSLALHEQAPVLSIAEELTQPGAPPVRQVFLMSVQPMAWWEKFLGLRSRYNQAIHAAEQQFRAAEEEFQQAEQTRQSKIGALHEDHKQRVAAYQHKVEQREQEIQELRDGYRGKDIDSVNTFFSIALDSSVYPDGFPQRFRVAFDPDARQLVVDYELPTVEIVPKVAEYRFVKSKNAIDEKSRKPAEIKDVYREIVAAVALRCIHECCTADSADILDVVTFNGFVNTVDPATGNAIKPYLISIRVTKERFSAIILDRIDTKACLRNLGAQVSPQPAELLAVKPIIEFDMVDKRFIDEKDVVSELDARPNLMDLTPAEFEALVGNLFTKMGLETKLTRTSRDGGVDAVAYDVRPILGGKVVIQAKRYSHTVGVSAVRDLYGTMMNEGANKGILVTTSSYGPDAYDFCKDKPIELVDGSGLLYHLEQVGVRARIIFPADHATAG